MTAVGRYGGKAVCGLGAAADPTRESGIAGASNPRTALPPYRPTAGFTLAELLVVLVIIGIAFGTVGLAVGSLRAGDVDSVPARLAAARRLAVAGDSAVTLTFAPDVAVTVYPDGSATPGRIWDGTTRWEVEPWGGEVRRVE